MESQLRRIVHGNPEQPNSTRDIRGFSPCQFKCLIDCLQSAYFEARLLVHLEDDMLQQVLFKMNGMNEFFGLPKVDFTNITLDQCRDHLKERMKVVEGILFAINQPYPGLKYSEEEKDWEEDFRVV